MLNGNEWIFGEDLAVCWCMLCNQFPSVSGMMSWWLITSSSFLQSLPDKEGKKCLFLIKCSDKSYEISASDKKKKQEWIQGGNMHGITLMMHIERSVWSLLHNYFIYNIYIYFSIYYIMHIIFYFLFSFPCSHSNVCLSAEDRPSSSTSWSSAKAARDAAEATSWAGTTGA